jgi:chromosome segregation ATPase
VKLRSYRRSKKIIKRRKEKDAKRIKGQKYRQRILETILIVAKSAFPIGTKLWLGRKRLTLFTLIWLVSTFGRGYNFGVNSSKNQIQRSKQEIEINRLQRDFQQLPALQSQIKNQEDQLEKAFNKMEEKEVWGEKLLVEYSMLETDLERLTETLEDIKTEQNNLNFKKDQKINNLKNQINDVELESIKNNLVDSSNTKSLKKKEKKLKQLVEINKKKLGIIQKDNKKLEKELNDKSLEIYKLKYSFDQKVDELNHSQKKIENLTAKIENLTSNIELTKMNSQEKTEQLNQNRFEIDNLNHLRKKDLELIEELQQKLIQQKKDFSQFEEELAEVRQELKSLTIDLEKKGQMRWVLYAVDQILSYKVFKRFK